MINKKVVSTSLPEDVRLMVFDLSIRGHHPNYIRHLINGWDRQQRAGKLMVVVSPLFLKEHADVTALAELPRIGKVEFMAVTAEEEALLRSRKSGFKRLLRAFQEWNLLCQYAQNLRATECFLPYFDTFQLPLIWGKSAPCPVSGIYFRPSFHYPSFATYRPARKDVVQHRRERFLINRCLRQTQLKKLFCIDPTAVEWMQNRYGTSKMVALADPIELTESGVTPPEGLKAVLGITPERRVFLLFGAITDRKGVYQLLDAIAQLSPEVCQQICILIVGESKLKHELNARIQQLTAEKPIQIIQHYEFVSDNAVSSYFQSADVVLAIYQKHVGMSGILLHAAAAKTPVLSSDYGLMGELTQRYQLGIAVDSTEPSAIANGMIQCLETLPEQLGDSAQMQAFAQQNDAEAFSSVILDNLFAPTGVAQIASALS
ncbi:MAG: glycosyltransferase [Cyanobacteria bacterium P01_C01_bin.120]